MTTPVDSLIDQLKLKPHPEGGFYRETYRSELEIASLKGFSGSRNVCTGIYFLLTSTTRSHFHRIRSDEMWHFYSGAPLRIHMIDGDGRYKEQTMGSDLSNGRLYQFVVPAGVWFGAEVLPDETYPYALVGCTVAPGFDFQDFEMADRGTLLDLCPDREKLIHEFCLK